MAIVRQMCASQLCPLLTVSQLLRKKNWHSQIGSMFTLQSQLCYHLPFIEHFSFGYSLEFMHLTEQNRFGLMKRAHGKVVATSYQLFDDNVNN